MTKSWSRVHSILAYSIAWGITGRENRRIIVTSRLKQMEASNKIALLRHAEGEIFTSCAEVNVIVYESYKAFYAENLPLDEDGDISHYGLDPFNLFAEQKDL